MKNYILNKILSTFLIVQVLFVSVISQKPDFIETYYSNGIYLVFSRFFRSLIGWIPIPLGDLFYAILILIILRWIWLLIKTRVAPFRQHLYAAGAFVSVIFFFFHLLWGLNYYRQPLQHQLGITDLTYTQEELIATTKKHIKKLNAIHLLISTNDSSVVEVPYKRRKIYQMAAKEYRNFYMDSIDFHFKQRSIKSSLISKPMCYLGFSGYLNPFTNEAQVNRKIPKMSFPVTTCHEMAHQLGYASESEANYIGFKACLQSDDFYFQYSGELMAVRYLLAVLSEYDKNQYLKAKKTLHYGIQKDIQKSHDFWDSYQTFLEPVFKKIYDTYLKANRQENGIKTYSEILGYLVNDNFKK